MNHVVNKEIDIENMSSIVNEHDVFPCTSKDSYSNASEMNTEVVVCDEIDEDDETCTAVDRYAMFDAADPYPKNWYLPPVKEKNPISFIHKQGHWRCGFSNNLLWWEMLKRRCYCSLQWNL